MTNKLSNEEMIAKIYERTNNLVDDLQEIKRTMVTQAEFTPIRNIVYGGVATVLVAVLSVALGLVLIK